MNQKKRESDNKYYYGYLEEPLYLIVHRPDGNDSIKILQKKLKGTTQEIFNKIVFYYAAIRIAKIKYEETLRKQEDFDKIGKLRKLKDECEALFDDYLKSIDKTLFLEAISEIMYWIAKVEGARQAKVHSDFLSSWAQWHKYIQGKNKNRLKGQQVKEKLRIIMGDKIDDYEKLHSEHMKDIERFKAGKTSIFINIEQEIDVNKAEPDNNLLLPARRLGDKHDFWIIEEYTECFTVGDETYNLRDYYELCKDKIDEDWIRSKNIINQIITIYLIKRCQNGDEEAFNKLFGLYRVKAEEVSDRYVRSRGQIVNPEDVKGRVLTILSALLKGDDPSHLLKTLNQGRKEKSGVDLLNKKIYVALNESYETMFMMISNQYKYIQSLLANLEKKAKDYRHRLKTAKKADTKIKYCKQIFAVSQHTVSWIESTSTIFSMLGSPLDFMKISPQYNKFLFQPRPNSNLTTWLLGDKNKQFRGMIWQSLCSLFDKRTSHNNESFSDEEYAESDNPDFYRKISKNTED